jgi:hypothetical protein
MRAGVVISPGGGTLCFPPGVTSTHVAQPPPAVRKKMTMICGPQHLIRTRFRGRRLGSPASPFWLAGAKKLPPVQRSLLTFCGTGTLACALCLTISFLSAVTLTLPNPERNPSGGDDATVSRRTPSIFRLKMPAHGVSTMLYVSLIFSTRPWLAYPRKLRVRLPRAHSR